MQVKFSVELSLDTIKRVEQVATRLGLSIPAYVEYCIVLQSEINATEQADGISDHGRTAIRGEAFTLGGDGEHAGLLAQQLANSGTAPLPATNTSAVRHAHQKQSDQAHAAPPAAGVVAASPASSPV